MLKSIIGVSCACLTVVSFSTDAAIIGPDGFGGNEFIQTYEDVDLTPGYVGQPIVLDGDTYISETLFYGDANCMSGFCLRSFAGSQTVRISLGAEANRVGVYIGKTSNPIEHSVTYYDTDGAILGSDNTGMSISSTYSFYGFESLDTSIAKVRLILRGGISNPVYFDNLITETVVPIPSAAWLFGSGLLGLVGLARRKANA